MMGTNPSLTMDQYREFLDDDRNRIVRVGSRCVVMHPGDSLSIYHKGASVLDLWDHDDFLDAVRTLIAIAEEGDDWQYGPNTRLDAITVAKRGLNQHG